MSSHLHGGMVAARGRDLRPVQVSDELFGLKDESINLKKKVNEQDDRTKQLITKVQKLSEDLRKAKDSSHGHHGGVDKPFINRKEMAEVDDMVADLRDQLRNVSKENSQLKTKMNFFKSLHESESRKGARYDHIPPRVNSNARKLQPALTVRGRGRGRGREAPAHVPQEYDDQSEEIAKLEEIITTLRGRLNDSEKKNDVLEEEVERLRLHQESQEQQADMERLAMQRELSDSRAKLNQQKNTLDALSEKHRGLQEAHEDAVKSLENLNEDLKEERRKRSALEDKLKDMVNSGKREEELNIIIEDLKAEKRLLEEEQSRLLKMRFSFDREDEFETERAVLRKRVADLQNELAEALREKSLVHGQLQTAHGDVRVLTQDKITAEGNMYNLRHELELLRDKLQKITRNGLLELHQIEEAITLWQLRHKKPQTADFIGQADHVVEDFAEDKKVLQDLRLQYAKCIEELEKTRKLLMMQERISKDYKREVANLGMTLQATKNEYELRLEEDSRLLDLRANRIAHLESQLKNIAYGTAKVPAPIEKTIDLAEDDVLLEKGQNLITLHLDAAFIGEDGFKFLRRQGLDDRDGDAFTSMIYFDFFDFETQVTPVGVGLAPYYNMTSRQKVYVDDFFLLYLQSKSLVLHMCRTDGTDFVEFATCLVVFKDIIDPHRTSKLQYVGQLISTHDGTTVIGSLKYSLSVKIPMVQAIRRFKERTTALNLLSVGNSQSAGRRFAPRASINELAVRIGEVSGLTAPAGKNPAVYLSFQFYNYDLVVTDTVHGSCNPDFHFYKSYPVPMSMELDRDLRTSLMEIVVLDDNEGLEDYVYGTAKISLLNLALNDQVTGLFDLQDAQGKRVGKINLTLAWERPYKLEAVPVVSQLDDRAVVAEFESGVRGGANPSFSSTFPTTEQADPIREPRSTILIQQESEVSLVSAPSTMSIGEKMGGSTLSLGQLELDSSPRSSSGSRDRTNRHRRRPPKPESTRASVTQPTTRELGSTRDPTVVNRSRSTEQFPDVTSPGEFEHRERAERDRSTGSDQGNKTTGPELSASSQHQAPDATQAQQYGLSLAPHRSSSSSSLAIDSEGQIPSEPPSELVIKETGPDDILRVSIDQLQLNPSSFNGNGRLQSLKALSVKFNLLGLSTSGGDDLESPDVEFGTDHKATLSFSHAFDFSTSTNPKNRFRLRRALKLSETNDADITFTILDRSPPREGAVEEGSGEEVAFGSMSLQELLDIEEEGGVFEIPLCEPEGEAEIGQLTVTIEGAHLVQRLLEE